MLLIKLMNQDDVMYGGLQFENKDNKLNHMIPEMDETTLTFLEESLFNNVAGIGNPAPYNPLYCVSGKMNAEVIWLENLST